MTVRARRRPRLVRAALLVLACGALAGCGASTIPAIHSEPERLEQARRAMGRGEHNVSIELLKTYVANNAGGADVDQAIELLGESYLRIKDWALAQAEFERLLRDYPESDSSAAGAYHLGVALWGQARGPDFDQEFTQRALEQWQGYLRGYPGHWLAVEAGKRVAAARTRLATKLANSGTLYLKLHLPAPAEVYFRRVLDEYADTPRAADARLGLALAEALQGHRPQAIAALRQVEAEYPGQPVAARAARERNRIERSKDRGPVAPVKHAPPEPPPPQAPTGHH
ncbi:MAG: outer membrane protein assembly factor BamD [Candidatus Eisenbacteria bacterium]|nr:outer membrane protein assembly factor BamD [Candidatus Eisenbacteria bacterium]